MSKKIPYWQKLQDPRWQKRRLEILNRDGWKCAACESTEASLHVHHRYYFSWRDPWDFPDIALITLCEKCHEEQGSPVAAAQIAEWEVLLSHLFEPSDADLSALFMAEALHCAQRRGITKRQCQAMIEVLFANEAMCAPVLLAAAARIEGTKEGPKE